MSEGHQHNERTGSPDESVKGNSAPVQIMRVLLSERGAVLLALVLVGVLAGVAWARSESAISAAGKAERETRLLEQQVMDQNALLVREGLRQPTDHTNGPAGNVQYQRKGK